MTSRWPCMLMFLNKGRAAILVSPVNPPEIQLYSYANVFVLVEKHAY